MGSIASGIFDLINGNPTQKEQNQFGDLSNFETGTGESGINAAQGYYGGILSGNPEEIAKTLAPEIQAGQQQVQQQAQTNAEFGNRGGGTNSATQAAKPQERGNIINLIGELQQGAAAGEAGIGENMLPQASGNLSNEAGLAEQNRKREAGDVGGIASGVASLAMPFLGGMDAAGSVPTLNTTGGSDPLGLNVPSVDMSGYPGTDDMSGLENMMGGYNPNPVIQ